MTKAIAFLGTGLMGRPMALRLHRAQYVVRAWNRTSSRLAPLVQAGITPCESPAEAVAAADIIVSMLDNGAVVGEVMQLASPGLRAGQIWIDMSSTGQQEAIGHAQALSMRGVSFIDAPVSGGVHGAEQGTLAIMAGGEEDHIEQVLPALRQLGRVTRVGPVGCGQLAKLCNQLIVGATLNVIAEALLLAKAGGADPESVRAAIRGGFAESRILEVHGQRMLERNFVAGGQVKSQAKDMDNIIDAANHAGLTLPIAEMVQQRYHELLAELAHADHSAALIALERLNPGNRLGDLPDRFVQP